MSDSMNRPDDERAYGGGDPTPEGEALPDGEAPVEGLRELDRLLAGMGGALASRAERRTRRRTLVLRWLPTAAVAAGVVLLTFVVPWRGAPKPESELESSSADWDIEAPGPFAVFPTSDANVVVIWLLNED